MTNLILNSWQPHVLVCFKTIVSSKLRMSFVLARKKREGFKEEPNYCEYSQGKSNYIDYNKAEPKSNLIKGKQPYHSKSFKDEPYYCEYSQVKSNYIDNNKAGTKSNLTKNYIRGSWQALEIWMIINSPKISKNTPSKSTLWNQN